MNATFIYSPRFTAWWREYRLDDEALRAMELAILREPKAGAILQATGGLRKLRLAGPGTGKSGGMRVCYAWIPEFAVVYMVLVFAKNVQPNLTDSQKAACRTMLAQMHLALGRTRRAR